MFGKERPMSRNASKRLFIEATDAIYKEVAAKLQIILDDWQKRHKEAFETKLEGWEQEIRESIRRMIREEYEKVKENEH